MVVIDTDLFSDVDDVGSLAIANVLHSCDIANVTGVAINTRSKYGALAASAINTYFGNPDIPVAAIRPLSNQTFFDIYAFRLVSPVPQFTVIYQNLTRSASSHGEYAAKLAHNWPRSINDSAMTPTPVSLYRRVLSSADDNSVTIISLGFLTNLATLMDSHADAISPLTGRALISTKVRELVVMGGQYPSGMEFNFAGNDIASTRHIVNHWPHHVPMTFSGFELGKDVISGAGLASLAPSSSPIRAAYEWYVGRCSTLRESWDPITTLYGILGLEPHPDLGIGKIFEYANDFGYNWVSPDGSNTWVNDSRVTNQHWLKLTVQTTNTSLASLLDSFYTHDPTKDECKFAASDGAASDDAPLQYLVIRLDFPGLHFLIFSCHFSFYFLVLLCFVGAGLICKPSCRVGQKGHH